MTGTNESSQGQAVANSASPPTASSEAERIVFQYTADTLQANLNTGFGSYGLLAHIGTGDVLETTFDIDDPYGSLAEQASEALTIQTASVFGSDREDIRGLYTCYGEEAAINGLGLAVQKISTLSMIGLFIMARLAEVLPHVYERDTHEPGNPTDLGEIGHSTIVLARSLAARDKHTTGKTLKKLSISKLPAEPHEPEFRFDPVKFQLVRQPQSGRRMLQTRQALPPVRKITGPSKTTSGRCPALNVRPRGSTEHLLAVNWHPLIDIVSGHHYRDSISLSDSERLGILTVRASRV